MAEVATTPALWRLTIHTVHPPVDEFEEVYGSEAAALSRIDSIVKTGGVSQFGTDKDNNSWIRFTPISNILYLEIHKKVG